MKKKIIIPIILIIIVTIMAINVIYKNLKAQFYLIDIDIEKDENNYAKVTNFEEFQNALENKSIKLIEIQNDIDLGYNNIKQEIKISNITSHNKPLTHPKLIETGISKIKIKNRDGLIIYSKNGSKLTHTNIIIENCKNIKIENIKMEELWEWDEETKGNYDRNDWDYITIKDSENICIRKCEFEKCYDGITDINNSRNITIEYCKLNKIDVNSTFFNMQFEYLEKNMEKYPMYNFLRKETKLSIQEVKELVGYQYKVYTIGSKKNNNEQNSNIIIHDNMFLNVKTRIPRLRNSKAYIYNNYISSANITNIKKKALANYEEINQIYKKIFSLDTYGVIATENSCVFVENCIFEGTGEKYKIYNAKEKLGFIIVMPKTLSDQKLKNKLEQIVGNKYEK